VSFAGAPVRGVLLDYGHTLMDFAAPQPELLEAFGRINARLRAEISVEVPGAAELIEQVSRQVDAEVDRSYRDQSEEEVDIATLYDAALRAIGLELSADTVEWVMAEEQRAWMHGIRTSPDAAAALGRLRQSGLRLCIVSNAQFRADTMRAQLAHLGIDGFFDATVFSSEVGWRKPNARIYEVALERTGLSASEVVFVGDRLREDVHGPGALGIRAILTHEFRQEPADGVEVIGRLGQLPGRLGIG
jgi:HAD superfamily hydrolase (TIGR01549 family)